MENKNLEFLTQWILTKQKLRFICRVHKYYTSYTDAISISCWTLLNSKSEDENISFLCS